MCLSGSNPDLSAIYMRKSSPAYLDKNIIESGAPLSKYLVDPEEPVKLL